MNRLKSTLCFMALAAMPAVAQSEGYEWPTDKQVLDKLDQWQDLKFGVLFHWGLYSVPGIVESWSICSEDVDWIPRRSDMAYDEYKKWYFGLQQELNPTQFDPQQWADVMQRAGTKYMIFTSKHHDGFCTYNSKYTDFSIAHGAFANNAKSDAARYVWDAFRDKGFMVGCYFSKPDWHCNWFWNEHYSTPDRHINYDKERHPDWWHNYQLYTQNQISELMSNYGKFDILWLDGGWISGDDFGLDSLLVSARKNNPGLLSVDRTIRGKNENYLTPERAIPATRLDVPWESCMPLSNDWGWTPNAPYKSAQTVINTLAEITAKGGCLLLGIGPNAQGLIEDEIIERTDKIGAWLKVNGKAIYGTRTTPVYNDGNIWFTADKSGTTLYAIYALPEGETLPATLQWTGNVPIGKVVLLNGNRSLKCKVAGDRVTVTLPRNLTNEPIALQFEVALQTPLYKNAAAPIESRVSDLLKRMTLDEKIGQVSCPMGWEMYTKTADGVAVSDKYKAMMQKAPIGSFWAVLRADPWTQKTLETGLSAELGAEAINALQRYAVNETRLGIPVLFAEECPHGHMAIDATVFPTSLSQASTWNDSLIYRMGEAIALETRAQGANVGYGPVLDIARDPRWSRVEETFGEDPVLTATLGSSFVRGMQGTDISDGKHVYSTLKHFTAYGMPEGGHNGARATTGMRQLFSEYMPAFKKCVDAGAATIMTSYNAIDGVPCTSNRYLLHDVLRGQWGFDGVVYSDLFSIDGIAGMGAATNLKESAALALRAGVDLDLGANAYTNHLKQAVEDGTVGIAQLDTAVANVLRLKFKMGLFENPYVDAVTAKKLIHNAEHVALAREVAAQGTVLLKNNGTLPLKKDIGTIAVIGPNADVMYNQLGDYTAPQDSARIYTVLRGIADAVAPTTNVIYAKGCAVRDTTQTDIAAAVAAANSADAVVLVLGGSSARDFKTKYIDTGAAVADAQTVSDMDCGEGFDRSTLDLLGDQVKLLNAIAATGKPLVVVYIQGRPLDMTLTSEKADALLTAWYPGEQGGVAVADILFGDVNPAGRLPISVPRTVGQIPVYYSQSSNHDYVENPNTPLYPFGFGLSYTTFSYDNLVIAPGSDNVLQTVSCTVTNTGNCDGDEVVQLYITDEVASVALPPVLLKAFKRISLKKGETKTVTFSLTDEQLGLYDASMRYVVEPGEFTVKVGASSADIRLAGSFRL